VLVGNYAGVDWATDKHDVLVEDEAGEQLVAATFAHDEKGLAGVLGPSGEAGARAGAATAA
jgi:hypothetical protein